MKKEINIRYSHYASEKELNTEEKMLFEAAKNARLKAYAPYSQFWVGCAVQLENGEVVTGNNQENAAYPSGMCAERTTIFYTAANFPSEKIRKIFIVGGPKVTEKKSSAIPPCGACRQSLLEYEEKQKSQIEIYFSSVDGEVYKTESVADLLPFVFDSTFL